MTNDIDAIALEVARRFTLDTEPQRRASLQVAIIEAIKGAAPSPPSADGGLVERIMDFEVDGWPVSTSITGNRAHKAKIIEEILRAADAMAQQPAAAPAPVVRDKPMLLAVALDFADNPRPYHSLQAPADTNGELYEALRVLASAYREKSNG